MVKRVKGALLRPQIDAELGLCYSVPARALWPLILLARRGYEAAEHHGETKATKLYGFDKATLDEMASTVRSTLNSIFADLQAVEDVIDDSEEAADIAAYDAVKARGEAEFPFALVRQLVAGEHPVKVYRRYRGLTQTALATEAGTTASYISQIETRRRIGSTALLRRLAAALDVTVDDLIEDYKDI